MRAVQATTFGDPGVLSVVELPEPTPGPGELTIDVTHSSVGLIDLFFRQGRLDGPGMPKPPFIPGLEVAGTVRELGAGVIGFRVGEPVVSMANTGTGGYATVFRADANLVISVARYDVDPALGVAMIPNAAMAHVALTAVGHLAAGDSVLVHGALGGLASAFPGVAKQLDAARVVGTVHPGRLAAAKATQLPYDQIVDSTRLAEAVGDDRFDVIIDPVGGDLRTRGLALLRPGGRLIAAGNASDEWEHTINDSQLWLGSVTVAGFNAGAFLPSHPHLVRPALQAARAAIAAGLGQIAVDTLPLDEAKTAHERMERRDLDGRIVLTAR